MKQCETYFQDVFSQKGKNLKNIVLAEDFNIKFLDFKTNKNLQDFLDLMFRYKMILLTKKNNTGNQTLSICHIPHYHQ